MTINSGSRTKILVGICVPLIGMFLTWVVFSYKRKASKSNAVRLPQVLNAAAPASESGPAKELPDTELFETHLSYIVEDGNKPADEVASVVGLISSPTAKSPGLNGIDSDSLVQREENVAQDAPAVVEKLRGTLWCNRTASAQQSAIVVEQTYEEVVCDEELIVPAQTQSLTKTHIQEWCNQDSFFQPEYFIDESDIEAEPAQLDFSETIEEIGGLNSSSKSPSCTDNADPARSSLSVGEDLDPPTDISMNSSSSNDSSAQVLMAADSGISMTTTGAGSLIRASSPFSTTVANTEIDADSSNASFHSTTEHQCTQTTHQLPNDITDAVTMAEKPDVPQILAANGTPSTINPRHSPVQEATTNVIHRFLIPANLCGMFIGKYGRNIQALKQETKTNIKVGREPVLYNFRYCTIEGSEESVLKALRLINKQYPKVDTNPVNEFGMPANMVLSADRMQLHLPMDVPVDVIVSHTVNAGHVFVQQPSHPSFNSWQNLTDCMSQCYGDGSSVPVLPNNIEDGVLCVVPLSGAWYRAQIMSPVPSSDAQCEVKLADVGGYYTVNASSLRQIRSDFLSLPFQAVECYLANIEPESGEAFSEAATNALVGMTAGRIVQCQIAAIADDGVPCILMLARNQDQVVVVNRELANLGLVKWVDDLNVSQISQ